MRSAERRARLWAMKRWGALVEERLAALALVEAAEGLGDPRGDVLTLFFGEARSMSCPSTKPGARSSSHPFIARHVFLRATNLADALILSQRGKKRAPPNSTTRKYSYTRYEVW